MSSSSADTIKFGIFLIGGGGVSLYYSLLKNKLKRKIEDIPTSKIKSAPIGDFVEVQARIYCHDDDLTMAPIGKHPCASFSWTIQKKIRRRKRTEWKTIEKFFSDRFLIVEDGEDAYACVRLKDCDFEDLKSHKTLYFRDNKIESLSKEVRNALKKYSTSLSTKRDGGFLSFISRNEYRIKETTFNKGERVYILGSTREPRKDELEKEDKLQTKRSFHEEKESLGKLGEQYSAALKDEEIVEAYDINGDGRLDNKERRKLHEDLKKSLLKNSNYTQIINYISKTKFIFEKNDDPSNRLFNLNRVTISSRSEEEMLRSLGWKIKLGFVLGILGVPAGIYVISTTLNR